MERRGRKTVWGERESESERKTCLTGQFSIIEEPLQNHKPVYNCPFASLF